MKLSSKLALFFACFGMSGLSYAQTSYTDVSVTTAWNDLRWNNSEDAEPYDSAFTPDNDVIFTSGAYLFAGMGDTIDLGNISLNSGVSVNFTASSGLLSTGGEISTLDIGSGSLLDFGSQAFTTAEAGMGFIKNGAGVLALTGGSYAGGLTLNAGTIIARGTSALGSGSLTLNGGTIASTANTTFSSAQLPGGITIGGNVQFGELSTNVALASNTATLSFGSAVNLGSGNRTFTLGNNGVQTFSGVISNTSGGITFAANAGTTGRFDITNIANTFTGDITITGGQARFSRDASLGNANNDVIIDGGVFSNSTTAITLGTGRSISLGDGAGSAINTQANITVQTGITDKSGETGALVKTGTGTLFLNGNNTYTGNTTISAGNLQINGTGRLGAGAYAGNISIAASRSLIFFSTASQTLSGQISGAGNFTVNLGTVKLTGTNSLTGTYTVGNGGVLDLVNNGALNGATSLVLNNGAVVDNSSSGAIALANNSMTKTITGLLNYYGTGGQSLSLGDGLTTISGNTTFNIDEGTLVFGSNLNASGISLTKDGTGVLQFNGLQTGRLAGTNTVSAGTLRIVSDNSLGSGIIIDVQDDATLSLDGNLSWTGSYILRNGSQLIRQTNSVITANAVFAADRTLTSADALTNGSQTIQSGVTINTTSDLFGTTPVSSVSDRIIMEEGSAINSNGSLNVAENKGISLQGSATFSTAANQSITVNSDISGDGGLTIAADGASGTVTLNGVNSYLGETLVSLGSLFVNGELGGGGAVVVEAGAALGGMGTIAGDVTFGSGSFLHVSDLNTPITINGVTTFGSGFGIANLRGINWNELAHGTYTLISTEQQFSSFDIANYGFENKVGVGIGNAAYFETGSLNLVVVPEPRAALLGGLGLLILLRRRRNS